MMQEIIQSFINLLSECNSFQEAAAKAFSKYHKELNIGYAYIKSEGFDPVLYSSTYDENKTYEYKGNLANVYIYNDSIKEWDNNQLSIIEAISKLLYLECEKHILRRSLNKANDNSNIISLPGIHQFKANVDCINQDDLKNYNSYYINIKSIDLINYTYGKKVGDIVIQLVGEGIEAYLNQGECFAHLGADKFGVLLKRNRNDEFLKFVSLFNIQKDPGDISISLQVSATVGICELTSTTKHEDVITFAQMAYKYARDEKKPFAYFNMELFERDYSGKEVEASFKNDLSAGSYVTFYQPKVDIESGRIIGFEALARRIVDGKVLSPDSFIGVLEKTRKIVDLDLFILEEACKNISNILKDSTVSCVPISCNLSKIDLEVPGIANKVLDIIKKYEIASEYIIIELTETSSIKEREILQSFIKEMRKNKIKISIDDFGIGYSSLSTLRDFKVSEIKIDRSFIDKKIYESDRVILSSIIRMAKKLGIHVICEGVETKKQADLLLSLGCLNAQGYLYDKPLSKDEFDERLKKQFYAI